MSDRGWHELARCEAPLEERVLWEALLEKTEHPQHYVDAVARAEVIDHDARTVVRRTWPQAGAPYIERIRHEVRNRRVETERHGHGFRRALARVLTPEGPCLVYQVDDPEAARTEGGIDEHHATSVLDRIMQRAQSLLLPGG